MNGTNMNNNWKKYLVIIIVLIIVLLFQNNSYKNKLESLENKVSSIINHYHSMEQNINYSINRIEDNFSRSMSDLVSYDFDYRNIDNQTKTIDVQMSFELKQVNPDAKYYVLYTPIDEYNDTESEVNALNGTSFKSTFTLSYKNNYSFKIIEKTKDGGIRRLSHDDIYSYIYDDLFLNKTILHSSEGSESRDQFALGFTISNKTFGQNELAMEKVELFLYYQDTLVYHEDITNKNDRNIMNLSSNTTSMSSFASSSSDSDYELGDLEELQIENYYVKIAKDDLLVNHSDILKKVDNYINKLSSKLVVTMKSGDKVTLQ